MIPNVIGDNIRHHSIGRCHPFRGGMIVSLKDDAPSQEEGTLARLTSKLAKGAVALFGITGILYGAGFLALRSHFAFLGIWNGVPPNSSLLAEEGGRFFYHLIFLPAGAISKLIKPQPSFFLGLAILLLATLLWDQRTRLYRLIGRNPNPRQTSLARRFYSTTPVLCLMLCLIFTIVLLIPHWQVMSLQDIVRTWDSIDAVTKAELERPEGLYVRIVIQLIIALAIAWWLYDVVWPATTRLERILVAAQWLLVLAALAALPVIYGRLLLPNTYPVFSFAAGMPDKRLLIEQTPDSWIVWNSTSKRTEIIPKNKEQSVFIGGRESLLQ